MKHRSSLFAAAAISLAGLFANPLAHADAGDTSVSSPRVPARILLIHSPPDASAAIASARAFIELPPPAADYTEAWRVYLARERALQIQRLSDYAEAGIFPRNDVRPGMLNIFVDDRGVRCAMSNLVYLSGHADLVAETARTNNATRLGEVTSGPLMDWMLTSGLTQEEAAFVQEPDFFVPPQRQRREWDRLNHAETQRLQTHFRLAVRQLRRNTNTSLRLALRRLGARVQSPPPPVA